MRIAMVSEHASPLAVLGGEDAGGQNVHVASLARACARAGHEVTVYTRRDDPHLPERVHRDGVVVHHLPGGPAAPVPKDELFPHMPELAAALEAALLRCPADLLHTHFWMSGWAGLQVARRLDVPIVHTFHALGVVKRRHLGDEDPSPPGRLQVERQLARDVDLVVATCADEQRELAALAGAGAAPVVVIPCGFAAERFRPRGGPRPPGPPRLLCLSRLVRRKGVDDAVRALAGIPDAELLVAGGPPAPTHLTHPEVRYLTDVAAGAGVADRVHLIGSVPHHRVPGLLHLADIVLSVPWYEPFGIVPVEAMGAGVPVVATAVGGMLDTVVDGRTGLLVRPHDPPAIAAAVRRLLDDPGLRGALGRRAARRAHRLYAWERVGADTLAVYGALHRRWPTTAGRAPAARGRLADPASEAAAS